MKFYSFLPCFISLQTLEKKHVKDFPLNYNIVLFVTTKCMNNC